MNKKQATLPARAEYFMRQALEEAEKAAQAGEIPVGAIIVNANGRIIGRGYNQTQQLNDVTAHAEMIAITAAAGTLGGKYLTDCTLYVTLEPCNMCAGALFWAQIGTIVIGAADEKRGFKRMQPSMLHPKTTLFEGVLADECTKMLLNFFQNMR